VPQFIPGLGLNARFFHEVAQPLIASQAPDLPYAAGRAGSGSDVLGYDTARSMDHDWGPRLTLFLADDDLEQWRARLDELLRSSLPRTFLGFPTGYGGFEEEPETMHMVATAGVSPVNHLVEITTPSRWVTDRLGIGQTSTIDPATWLTLSEQSLLETISGMIFRDDSGEISAIRSELAWYPDDIWRYRLAAQWMRIDQLEPFIGRCGEIGDDPGSQLVAMSVVRDVMKLAFLMERRYAPYAKWFGTAFARLDLASALAPHLNRARFANAWEERERGVVDALAVLANRHNALGLTEWIDPAPRQFHARPFTVMSSARFSEALLATILNSEVRALPRNLGGIDQYIDSTDAMNNHGLHEAIRQWITQG